ncbi:A24 family peptidase [Lichenibacterium ramalinae]|uniref:Peptidase n=1 Tax=Lichenibacterium ramalinae TaxID=2316527 RepID=A0A4V1RJ84_9HYPH|nr:prepilin peptidase [Lichenibacterium ramalinae]RYB07670.1 peptidase [Lichenibacterium ramalinae]
MLVIVVLVLFPLLMAYSAASDLLTMTISNRVSIALVLGFAAVALASGMPLATLLTMHLACGAAVLVLTFALFAFGWIGGGDAKLAASTAVWLGWANLYEYGLAASILGAGLTLGILMLRKRDLPPLLATRAWAVRIHTAGNGVPYGIALAVAGLALYPETAAWLAAAHA